MAAGFNIATVQFLSWNRNVMELWDILTEGQYVCRRYVIIFNIPRLFLKGGRLQTPYIVLQ